MNGLRDITAQCGQPTALSQLATNITATNPSVLADASLYKQGPQMNTAQPQQMQPPQPHQQQQNIPTADNLMNDFNKQKPMQPIIAPMQQQHHQQQQQKAKQQYQPNQMQMVVQPQHNYMPQQQPMIMQMPQMIMPINSMQYQIPPQMYQHMMQQNISNQMQQVRKNKFVSALCILAYPCTHIILSISAKYR